MNMSWIDWIIELQAIAQIGLHYSNDDYNLKHFTRIREIAADMMSKITDFPVETVKDLFCNETGYQTPKIDARAVVIRNDKILLVKENPVNTDANTNTWALPGGWVDINESVKSNTIKKVREETGLEVTPMRLIAIQDRNRHNKPKYAYSVCKIFILCNIKFGTQETPENDFFDIGALPELANEINTFSQIHMCYKAYYDNKWVVQFD